MMLHPAGNKTASAEWGITEIEKMRTSKSRSAHFFYGFVSICPVFTLFLHMDFLRRNL